MKTKFISLAVISMGAASLLLTSCKIDEPMRGGASTGKVIIDVNADNAIETKAGSRTRMFETLDLSSDGVDFFLSGTESVYNENPFTSRIATKGTIITTDDATEGNAAINSDGMEFKVTVLNDGGMYHTINNTDAKGVIAKYDPNGVETKWPLLTEVDWPDQAPKALDFWAYYDAIGAATPSGDGYSTYAYKGPASGKAGMDASLMSDFLVANNVGATQNNVKIHFYHALSAVRFHVDPLLVKREIKGLKVIVSGIYNEGDVEYNGNESDMCFHWDFTGCKPDASYEQVLFDANGAADLDNSTMFLVPQKVGKATDVRFTFVLVDWDGHETVMTTDNVGTDEWKPGYIYDYNVGQDRYGNVGVKVNEGADGDTFDHFKKENVRFELTKSAASYLRVAVIANWCLSSNKVYQSYTGGFEYNTYEWVKGDDGFYYSKYPVLGHTESENFIDEFTPKGTVPTAPYALHLEMNFLVQAISFDVKDVNDENGVSRAEYAWGAEFKRLLELGEVSNELR